MTTVPVVGTTYYRCGPNWFQEAYAGGEVSYVVVAPAPGYRPRAAVPPASTDRETGQGGRDCVHRTRV